MKRAGIFSIAIIIILFLLCMAALPVNAESGALSYNSEGEAVLSLQSRLAELGYYTFRITGVYQEHTRNAVRAFQQANGLPVTGVADAELQQMIQSPAALPVPTQAPTPTPAPLVLLTPFPGKVSYGSTGDDVRRVQTRLSQLGFYTDGISGQFMDKTMAAVKRFQQQNALKADGIVGKETWQALFFDTEALDAFATPRPTPAPTPVPYRIGIDVTNQVTTVYGLDAQGEYTNVVRRMICSSGTLQDETKPGTYVLNGANARWGYFPKWGSYAQYWTRIDKSNAFHSVLYRQPDVMTLAVGSYTGLGKRASHGCIRLMVEDAKWIYDNIGKGTEVVVYYGEEDPELSQLLRVPPLDKGTMLPVPTPLPTPEPAYSASAMPEAAGVTLRRGAENELVYWVQRRLTELGYYKGSITGGYYEGTMEAVRSFQRDHGLSVDGHSGPETLGKMREQAMQTPSPHPAETALPRVTARPRQGTDAQPLHTQAPTETSTPTWFDVN